MSKKHVLMQKSVKKKARFNSIGANIRTRRGSCCLPYAGFLINVVNISKNNKIMVWKAQLFQASILVGGGSFMNGAYPL